VVAARFHPKKSNPMIPSTLPSCRCRRLRFRWLIALCLGLPIGLLRAQTPPASFTASFTNGGSVVTVDFTLHPVRSTNFNVLVQNSSGGLDPYAAPPARTYFGTVQGKPGALAAAVLRAGGQLLARICFENEVEWFTEGNSIATRGSASWSKNWPGFTIGAGGAGSSVYAAEVGVDSSYEHFARCGASVEGDIEVIEYSVICANMYYLRDAGILHRLGRIVIRASQARDPYQGLSSGTLLDEMRNQWNNVLPPGTHDLAAGAFADSVGGGLAWVGVIGSSLRYSINDSEGNGDFNVYWRHEAGHNWGAGHYEGNSPEGPTIMSGNALGRFSSPELARVVGHRQDKSSLLDPLGSYPFSLPPRASLDFSHVGVDDSALLNVLANDHDANGDALTIESFDAATSLGGAVTLESGQLRVQGAADHAEMDWFNYRIVDSTGRPAIGIVYLQGEKPSVKLTGSGIGTPGTWGGGNTFVKALDGNLNTFYDAANETGDWVGLDLGAGSNLAVTKIRYCPRTGYAGRMNGGQIQASSVADFSSDVVSLFTINYTPAEGVLTTQVIPNNTAYRYVRYFGPTGGSCNLAEIEFWGDAPSVPHVPWNVTAAGISGTQILLAWRAPAFATSYNVKRATNPGGPYAVIASGWTTNQFTDNGRNAGTTYYYVVSAVNAVGESADSPEVQAQPATPLKLSGLVIGTPGTWGNGNTITNVFDNSLTTFYDAANGSGDWAGLDLGTAKSIRQVRYCPRVGHVERMLGGQFQGANVPDFSSGVVTLGTVTTLPPTGKLTVMNLSNPTPFRYVRYLGPDGGWCNVAEVQFWGVAPPAPGGPTAFSALTRLPDGSISLVLTGAPGQTLILEATSNLTPPIGWTPLLTNQAGASGTVSVTDWQATNFSTRYYRIKSP